MNLNDLLNVELYNDNLKMFNLAWEETLLAPGNDLDEHVLENLHEAQVRESTSRRTYWHYISKTLFWKGSREATRDEGRWWMTSFEQQQAARSRNFVVMIESVITGTHRIANYSKKKKHVEWDRIVHSFTAKEETIYQSSTKREVKQKTPTKKR